MYVVQNIAPEGLSVVRVTRMLLYMDQAMSVLVYIEDVFQCAITQGHHANMTDTIGLAEIDDGTRVLVLANCIGDGTREAIQHV